MKTEVYEKLEDLHKKYGPREFGKICQKLLAIAFREAGFSCVAESERGVQGVDIGEAVRGDEKYSIEVKTTTTDYIYYEKKDEDGLRYKKEQGYQPILAVLKIDRFANWFFVKADELDAGKIYIDSLRVYRIHKLEEEILPYFEKATIEHYKETRNDGQNYLDRMLRKK
ncbi:MAG: hypothetical protein ABIK10_06260 [candidate division WOR-3 bacterium]